MMENMLNDRVWELVKDLNKKQDQLLKKLNKTGSLESTVKLREEIRNLRSDFHLRLEKLKQDPS